MTTRVLLVGESWASTATHAKGFDLFTSTTFHLGAEPLVAACGPACGGAISNPR